jgi:hypothetical protein
MMPGELQGPRHVRAPQRGDEPAARHYGRSRAAMTAVLGVAPLSSRRAAKGFTGPHDKSFSSHPATLHGHRCRTPRASIRVTRTGDKYSRPYVAARRKKQRCSLAPHRSEKKSGMARVKLAHVILGLSRKSVNARNSPKDEALASWASRNGSLSSLYGAQERVTSSLYGA